MVISLIHPSRGRPQRSFDTAMKWLSMAGDCQIEHIFSLDLDDPTRQQYTLIDKIVVKNNDCVVKATNHGAQASVGDLLIYLSDDFDCFPGWGERLTEIASHYKGEFMIKADDGLQRFSNQVLTIPIMSRALYNRLGYFFNPEYKSMWVDVDLFYVCERLESLRFHRELVFKHNHYTKPGSAPKDATNARSDDFWYQGKAIYDRRKREGFPV